MKDLASTLILIVIFVSATVGIVSHYALGKNNHVEKKMERVVDILIEVDSKKVQEEVIEVEVVESKDNPVVTQTDFGK